MAARAYRFGLRALVVGAASALTFVPAIAAAQDQPWLSDRRFTEGVGIRAGDFELHPGVGADFGYDSNFLHRDSSESPIQSLRFRITPSFLVESLTPQRREHGQDPVNDPSVIFSGMVSATYNEYIPIAGGTSAADRSDLSQQRNVGVEVDLKATILPNKPFSVGLLASYFRLLNPTNQSLPSPPDGSTFNRDTVTAGADLMWTPGAGLFDWHLGYAFTGMFFESGEMAQLDNIQHQIETRARWKFLPRTAMLFDAKFAFINYPSAGDPGVFDAFGAKTASHPLRTTIGINGQVTNWLKVLAVAGWGASFYTPKPQEDFDSVIGQAELQFYLTGGPAQTSSGGATLSVSSIAVGFQRDFVDSFVTSYYEQDRGYAALNYFYNGILLVQVLGAAGPLVYPNTDGKVTPALLPAAANNGWTDVLIDTSFYAEYRIRNVFGIGATFKYDQMISSTKVPATGATGGLADSLAWRDIQAYLTLRYVM